jgi:large repetitive protein
MIFLPRIYKLCWTLALPLTLTLSLWLLIQPMPAHAATLTVTKTADTNDGVCDSDCSLREAIATASAGDTIFFAPALSGQTITLTGQLTLDSPLTIDGSALAEHVKISGHNSARVFYITAEVTLTHLDIINGRADSGGGLFVTATGNLTLNDCVVSGNVATGSGLGGGGLHVPGGNATINRSRFTGNTAQTTSGGGGGGLYVSASGSVTITDSIVANNVTGYAGGGAYNNDIGSSLIVHRSTFSGNTALYGGAIGNQNGLLRLNNSTISGNANTSPSYGGSAMDLWGGNSFAMINHCTIVSNTANVNSDKSGILLENGVLLLSNSIVAGNNGSFNFGWTGGAFTSLGYNLANAWNGLPLQPTDLTGAPLLAALADNGGPTLTHALLPGSPALDAANPTVSLTADQRGIARPQDFDHNGDARSDIGAFEAIPPEIFLTKSVVPAVAAPYRGVVTYTLVLHNTGAADDPTVFLTDTLPTQVTFARWVEHPGASVASDEITWNGVLTAHTALTFTFQVTHTGDYAETVVNTAEFSGAVQTGQAAASFSVECGPTLTVQNTADSGPGSLRHAVGGVCAGGVVTFAPALAGQTITLTSEIVIDKPLTLDGGGLSEQPRLSGDDATRLFVISDTATVTMTQLTLARGYGSYHPYYLNYGGAIYNAGALTLQEMLFTDNEAQQGGAVYSYYDSRLWVHDSEFYRNQASEGGALYVYYDNTVAEVTGTIFMTNTAYQSGGAVHNQHATLTVTDSLISGNTSNHNGGGLGFYGDSVTTLSGCAISRNQAVFGGGLYNFDGAITITGTHFLSNTATYGGALYSSQGHLSVTQTLVASNTADEWGGGLFLRQGIAAISDSTLRDNRTHPITGRWGGAILNIEGNQLTVMGSAFTGNYAAANGGGIYNSTAPLTVQAGEFISNTAQEGGGIYSHSGALNVTASAFYSNTANENGGGLHVAGDNANITASAIVSNTAPSGAGIYNENSVLTLANSTLSGNVATVRGGALTNNLAPLTLRHVTLATNSAPTAGGLLNLGGPVWAYNSILAHNAGGDCDNTTDPGTVNENVHNFVADGSCQENDIGFMSGDLRLVALNSAGFHALLPTSPAIDAGNAAYCLAADQRGEPRDDLGCDIGAFEMRHADSDRVVRSGFSGGAPYTFGPTWISMTLAMADTGTITVTKRLTYPGGTHDPGEIAATWWISSTLGDGFPVTLAFCYTDEEVAGLDDESALRAFRWDGEAWVREGEAPPVGNCVTVAGVTAFSAWTLFDTSGIDETPTAVSLSSFSAASQVGWVGLLVGVMGVATAVLRRRRM